jgi:hypothetical protein
MESFMDAPYSSGSQKGNKKTLRIILVNCGSANFYSLTVY